MISDHQRRKYGLSEADADALAEKSGGFCGICEGYFREGQEATIDHIRPQAAGGSDWLGNLQLAHRGCNASKRDRAQSGYGETWDGRSLRSL